jgi:hypothetical protein
LPLACERRNPFGVFRDGLGRELVLRIGELIILCVP